MRNLTSHIHGSDQDCYTERLRKDSCATSLGPPLTRQGAYWTKGGWGQRLKWRRVDLLQVQGAAEEAMLVSLQMGAVGGGGRLGTVAE